MLELPHCKCQIVLAIKIIYCIIILYPNSVATELSFEQNFVTFNRSTI